MGKLATASLRLAAAAPDDDSVEAARRLLSVAPDLLGATRRTGTVARRLTSAWVRRPSDGLVRAVDTAMALLADHELATSTLAVRVAASVRATPYAAYAAGLATVGGPLHGSAAASVHRFLERCERDGVEAELGRLRATGRRVPGFGHSVYRTRDPRYATMREAVGSLGTPAQREMLDAVVGEVTRTVALLPNVDLALGALSWLGGLPPDVPIFAVARIAGWAAHDAEERLAPPLRYRGLAR